MKTAESQYLEIVMEEISNIIYNAKSKTITKEMISESLQRTLTDYNQTFNKNIR